MQLLNILILIECLLILIEWFHGGQLKLLWQAK
jgi:hypothetical protein